MVGSDVPSISSGCDRDTMIPTMSLYQGYVASLHQLNGYLTELGQHSGTGPHFELSHIKQFVLVVFSGQVMAVERITL